MAYCTVKYCHLWAYSWGDEMTENDWEPSFLKQSMWNLQQNNIHNPPMLERMSTVAVLASRPHKGAACVPFAALCFYIYTITNAAWNPCWLALNLKNCARVLWQSPAQAFWDSWSHLKVLDHRQDFTTIAALGISSWARVRVKMTPLASALQHNSSNMRYWSFFASYRATK